MHYQQFRQSSQLCFCLLVTYFWKSVDVFDLDCGGLGPALPGFLVCPSPVVFSIMKNCRGCCRATYRGCGLPKSCVWWLLTELSHWRPWWEPGGGRLGEARVISLLLLPWADALAAGEFFLGSSSHCTGCPWFQLCWLMDPPEFQEYYLFSLFCSLKVGLASCCC